MIPGKKISLVLCVFLAALVIAACSSSAGPATQNETITVISSSFTPDTHPLTPCGYVWASQSLPDISKQVQSAFISAGLSDATARAEAYGENCVEDNGAVRSFGAMETDFYIQLPVPDLSDRQALGDLLEKALVIIDQFPPGTVPGPNPGYVGVEFNSGQEILNLHFTVTASKSARNQGLHGADLLAALSNN
jgi:hypothetical protein